MWSQIAPVKPFAVATALRRRAAEQPARNASHSEATTKHIAPKKVGRTRAPCQVAAATATQIYVAPAFVRSRLATRFSAPPVTINSCAAGLSGGKANDFPSTLRIDLA